VLGFEFAVCKIEFCGVQSLGFAVCKVWFMRCAKFGFCSVQSFEFGRRFRLWWAFLIRSVRDSTLGLVCTVWKGEV